MRTMKNLAGGSMLIAALTGAPLGAQDTPPPACVGTEYNEFDFWVGSWQVFNAEGQQIGTNRITRIADGCGLLEEWTPARGNGAGKSLNFFDSADGQWHQVWVGGGGAILRLSGGLENGAMVLTGGARTTPRGVVRDRIRWTPQKDGAVEQVWEISGDGGTSWSPVFAGLYKRGPV